jgi:hypothetical protein
VHLSNKKGAWFKFPKDAGVRNGYIRVKRVNRRMIVNRS